MTRIEYEARLLHLWSELRKAEHKLLKEYENTLLLDSQRKMATRERLNAYVSRKQKQVSKDEEKQPVCHIFSTTARAE